MFFFYLQVQLWESPYFELLYVNSMMPYKIKHLTENNYITIITTWSYPKIWNRKLDLDFKVIIINMDHIAIFL